MNIDTQGSPLLAARTDFAVAGRRIADAFEQTAGIAQDQQPGTQPASTVTSFSGVLAGMLDRVDERQRMAEVDRGDSDDLVGAMLASQEAGLSFAMLVQVRNKVASAFDDVLKMPI